jgi:hypothetical protein
MIIDEIIAALLLSHSADLQSIKKYVAWVRYRRMMHNAFYTGTHWVQSSRKYHWVGRWL